MEALGNLLNKRVGQSSLQKDIAVSVILNKANEVIFTMFGQLAIDRAKAIYVKNDCLCLAILSNPLAQNIKMREGEFIGKLNDILGQEIVKKIRYMG